MLNSRQFVPWYENMTSSIKPEVHNISQHHQRRTEPQPQATCIKNLCYLAMRFLVYVSKQTNKQIDRQTDKQMTNRHTEHNTSHPLNWFWWNLFCWCILALSALQGKTNFKNARWQKAAILKIEKSQYLHNALTDFDELAECILALWTLSANKVDILKNPRWQTAVMSVCPIRQAHIVSHNAEAT